MLFVNTQTMPCSFPLKDNTTRLARKTRPSELSILDAHEKATRTKRPCFSTATGCSGQDRNFVMETGSCGERGSSIDREYCSGASIPETLYALF